MRTVYLLVIIFICINLSLATADDEIYGAEKCGTSIIKNIRNGNVKNNKLLFDFSRPSYNVLPDTVSSPSGIFLIHFTKAGINAVSTTDKNSNGIPDYIDSVAYYFDLAYRTEVDTLGFPQYAADYNHGGTNQYDIYVEEMGIGTETYYGATNYDTLAPSDNRSSHFTSYIVIDNNFSATDSTIDNSGKKFRSYYTTGIEALKVTSAHEFNHALQFLCGDANADLFNEMTSVYMETRVHPDVKDYLQYIKSLFNHFSQKFFGNGDDGSVGYSYAPLVQLMAMKYGDTFIRKVWQSIDDGNMGYVALDKELQKENSSLNQLWMEFIPYLYYSNTNYNQEKHLHFSEFYPDYKKEYDTLYTSEITANYQLKSYELYPLRVMKPMGINSTCDTITYFITNLDLYDAVYHNPDATQSFTLTINDRPTETLPIGTSGLYYNLSGNPQYIADSLFIKSAVDFVYKNSVYPNPYHGNRDNSLCISVDKSLQLGEKVDVYLFNPEMYNFYSTSCEVCYHEQDKAVLIDIPKDKLYTGVCIYKVSSKVGDHVGKFAIVK